MTKPLLALSLFFVLACDSGGGEDATGGGGGEDPTGGTGDHFDPRNGSVGSSCGTCQAGLTCATQAAGGYCTKTCAGDDCGADALCYQTDLGPACLRTCGDASDCREGYACQGNAGQTVCYPGSDPGGECANLIGSWGFCGDATCEEITFLANGTAEHVAWTQVSGSMNSAGTYTGCPTVRVTLTSGYSAGESKTYVLQNDGLYESGVRFGKCEGHCL